MNYENEERTDGCSDSVIEQEVLPNTNPEMNSNPEMNPNPACLGRKPWFCVNADVQRKSASAMGWRFMVFGFSNIILQTFCVLVVQLLFPEFYLKNMVTVSFIMLILSTHILGTLTVFLLCLNIKPVRFKKSKLPIWKFPVYLIMTAGLCGVGSVIGTIVESILSLILTGSMDATDPALAEMMLNSSFGWRVLTVGIMAPIAEELIFRKFLIDRTVQYGQFLAIFLSGLIFGLFHGNFAQFFFATMIGWFFAYIYIKTGNVVHTIFLHMGVNLTTSVITIFFAKKYMEVLDGRLDVSNEELVALITEYPLEIGGYLVWILFLMGVAGVGCIIWILALVFKKIRLTDRNFNIPVAKTTGVSLFNWGMIGYFVFAICLFGMNYLQLFVTGAQRLIEYLQGAGA